jgi:Na+-transporting methylmalonyl-CoA/oxaloacetate decarboxylase gamma subunit
LDLDVIGFLFLFFIITLLSFSGKVISACLFTQIILAANSDELDEKAKAPVVQQRGRFKVTSENVDFEKVNFTIPDLISLSCEG